MESQERIAAREFTRLYKKYAFTVAKRWLDTQLHPRERRRLLSELFAHYIATSASRRHANNTLARLFLQAAEFAIESLREKQADAAADLISGVSGSGPWVLPLAATDGDVLDAQASTVMALRCQDAMDLDEIAQFLGVSPKRLSKKCSLFVQEGDDAADASSTDDNGSDCSRARCLSDLVLERYLVDDLSLESREAIFEKLEQSPMDRQHLDCLLKQRLNFLAGHAALPFEDVLRKEDVPATQPSHRRRIAAPIAAAFTMGLGVLVLLTQAGPWASAKQSQGLSQAANRTIVAENSPTVPVVGLSAPLEAKNRPSAPVKTPPAAPVKITPVVRVGLSTRPSSPRAHERPVLKTPRVVEQSTDPRILAPDATAKPKPSVSRPAQARGVRFSLYARSTSGVRPVHPGDTLNAQDKVAPWVKVQQPGYAAVLALTQRGGRRVLVAENGEAVPVQAGGPTLLTKAKRLHPEDVGEIQTFALLFSPTPFSVHQVIAQLGTKGTTLREVFDGVIRTIAVDIDDTQQDPMGI